MHGLQPSHIQPFEHGADKQFDVFAMFVRLTFEEIKDGLHLIGVSWHAIHGPRIKSVKTSFMSFVVQVKFPPLALFFQVLFCCVDALVSKFFTEHVDCCFEHIWVWHVEVLAPLCGFDGFENGFHF